LPVRFDTALSNEIELAEALAALWQRHRDEPYTIDESLADDEDALIERFAART
jgi:hypothetical protein